MTTSIKAKLKKSDEHNINIEHNDKYRVAVNKQIIIGYQN